MLRHELKSYKGEEREKLVNELGILKQTAKGRGRSGLSAKERREWDVLQLKLKSPDIERKQQIGKAIADMEKRKDRAIELDKTRYDPTKRIFLTSPRVIETGVQAGHFTHILYADSGGFGYANQEQFRGRFSRSSNTHPRTEFRDYKLSLDHGGTEITDSIGNKIKDKDGNAVHFKSPDEYAGHLRDAKMDLIEDVHDSFRQGTPMATEDIHTEKDVSGYLPPNYARMKQDLKRFYNTKDRFLKHSANYRALMASPKITRLQQGLMQQYAFAEKSGDSTRAKVTFSKMNKEAKQAARIKQWRDQTEKTYVKGMETYSGKKWQRVHGQMLEEQRELETMKGR